MEKKKTKKLSKFFTERRKKGLVLCCMIALLVTVSYLNVTLTNKQNQDAENVDIQSESAFFQNFEAARQQRYNEQFCLLDNIIQSKDSTDDAKKDAEEKKQKLIDQMGLEADLHQILAGKGLPYVGVVICDTCVNVMVYKDSDLDQKEKCKIYDTLTSQTDFEYEQVIIS